MDIGRRTHYGHFYGLEHAPDGAAIVLGNCQAESLRQTLTGADLPTVRIPPVHELTADDMPHLDRLLRSTRLVVAQPVRDSYHDLPLGSAQIRDALPASAQFVAIPVVRHRSLQPAQVIVRSHTHEVIDPPIVGYHDLRVMAEALGLAPRALTAERVREIARTSTAELRAREERNDTVRISDLFDTPHFDLLRTINHPGNPVWFELARRVRARLGLALDVSDPGRPLLDSVRAPREAAVIEAWNLEGEPTDEWLVDGAAIPATRVRDAHLAWYSEHPDRLAFAASRHEPALRELLA